MNRPKWKKIAILATDGFEETELTVPQKALQDAGSEVVIVSPKAYLIQSFNYIEPGEWFAVDKKVTEANPDDYDALVIPGGVINSDHLRSDLDAIRFIQAFMSADKPVAAIGHAPWVLIETHDIAGRTMTATKTVRTDLSDAGAHEVDADVVVDGNLITSRGRDDLPAFCRRLIELNTEMPKVEPLYYAPNLYY